MLDRSLVEEKNAEIQKLGMDKVGILEDITKRKTQMQESKWNLQTLELELKDQADLTFEIQLLRVTKSLQSLIASGGHDKQKSVEINNLNRKIEFLTEASADKVTLIFPFTHAHRKCFLPCPYVCMFSSKESASNYRSMAEVFVRSCVKMSV